MSRMLTTCWEALWREGPQPCEMLHVWHYILSLDQGMPIYYGHVQVAPHQYCARRVVDLGETYWLVCKRYHCSRCDEAGRRASFNMWDPEVLQLYHASIVEELDVVFTYKCAVSQALADYITDHAISAASFEAMHRHIKHNHHKKCARAR